MTELIHGDCIEVLRSMPDCSVDAVVTDPPYGLSFMGKKWDYDVPGVDVWAECLRVLKPGGHLLAFAGTRTQHRMAVRIEDAGFEIRDMIAWVYGSGFPKSLDVSKAIDKAAGADREVVSRQLHRKRSSVGGIMNTVEVPRYNTVTAPATDAAKQWQGWGTALKPSWESITVAQKPIQSSSDVEFFFVSLLHTLKTELCQYQSFALIAEKHLMSSRSESGEVLSIAQWTAEKSTNIQADLSDLMGMLQLGLETNINWSTVSSWLNTLGALYKAMNTCTIETASSLTIELKTLNLLEWASILQSIMQSNGTSQNGQSANVCTAEILFSALELKLRTIQILSVIDTATLRGSDGGFAPNLDPIVVARKPLIGTVAENVLQHGTGAINVDGGRVGKREKEQFIGAKNGTVNSYGNYFYEKSETPLPDGRWPANFIHDGSKEVVGLFPHTKAGVAIRSRSGGKTCHSNQEKPPMADMGYADGGSAARFFYCAKASKSDRDEGCEGLEERQRDESRKEGNVGGDNPRNRGVNLRTNHHPTVKPTDLMRYLCRLVTPPGGTVLDPFMGSGSTGKAAVLEGFSFIGIEREAEYIAIAEARIKNTNPPHFW